MQTNNVELSKRLKDKISGKSLRCVDSTEKKVDQPQCITIEGGYNIAGDPDSKYRVGVEMMPPDEIK